MIRIVAIGALVCTASVVPGVPVQARQERCSFLRDPDSNDPADVTFIRDGDKTTADWSAIWSGTLDCRDGSPNEERAVDLAVQGIFSVTGPFTDGLVLSLKGKGGSVAVTDNSVPPKTIATFRKRVRTSGTAVCDNNGRCDVEFAMKARGKGDARARLELHGWGWDMNNDGLYPLEVINTDMIDF